mmetsp:Transcript_26349/g.51923  ORF Transcript_26349/g.51923 Transcript_26349/m.51923 type:complete len:120 (+) Transcript_26349:836-1195(+)
MIQAKGMQSVMMSAFLSQNYARAHPALMSKKSSQGPSIASVFNTRANSPERYNSTQRPASSLPTKSTRSWRTTEADEGVTGGCIRDEDKVLHVERMTGRFHTSKVMAEESETETTCNRW